MQAVSCFVHPLFPSKSAIFISSPSKIVTPTSLTTNNISSTSLIKATSSEAFEPLAFNYNSQFSVFPAEACEILGGDACTAVMYPEVKLDKPKMSETNTNNTVEQFDREYFDYDSDPKSVLRGEACDDLGGEFCEAPYINGVY
ncbi:light-regulated protein, chloroplastic [Beta vulgaris subsp. vulgaris]|uniref:light-regulated protein, chloroplastic n=1 Tax=Beta vulgaris subsp. vulgaris TaxID=3555 RepID=UPI0020366ED5|nr:light-regulated protein, chloroplastic [Beta vulgaris subsp. vulgaris]